MIVVHQDGYQEDEEDSKDYIALHVYPADAGKKITRDSGCLHRSTYSSEQTII